MFIFVQKPLGSPCLDPSIEVGSIVLNVVRLLSQMYGLLEDYNQAAMKDAATRLSILLAALNDMSEAPLWRMKPTIHSMLHLAQSLHSPTKTWIYREEDYGGSAARLMRSRKGHDAAKVAFCCPSCELWWSRTLFANHIFSHCVQLVLKFIYLVEVVQLLVQFADASLHICSTKFLLEVTRKRFH